MDDKKILVIDDEEDVVRVLEKRLTGEGYAVLKAYNGQEGVFLARKHVPDLILLDLSMPGMDGGEVGQVLRNDPDTKKIPIIYLTALVTKGEAAQRGIGGNIFIAKPYEPRELLEMIRKCLA